MSLLTLLFLLVPPSIVQEGTFKPPLPGPRELPISRAQEVAQAFADRAGFKVKVASLPSQFVVTDPSSKNGYPVVDERRWYLGGPASRAILVK